MHIAHMGLVRPDQHTLRYRMRTREHKVIARQVKLFDSKRHQRQITPILFLSIRKPLAIEQFDLSGYDLVLSSSHAVAKGVLVGPDQTHVSYVHSPIRYAWDLQHQYLREARLEHGPRSWAARMLLHYLRNWDARSANGVDRIIANSHFV